MSAMITHHDAAERGMVCSSPSLRFLALPHHPQLTPNADNKPQTPQTPGRNHVLGWHRGAVRQQWNGGVLRGNEWMGQGGGVYGAGIRAGTVSDEDGVIQVFERGWDGTLYMAFP